MSDMPRLLGKSQSWHWSQYQVYAGDSYDYTILFSRDYVPLFSLFQSRVKINM